MDVTSFLERLTHAPGYAGQLEHVEVLPERPGRFAEPATPLRSELVEMLQARGIERLYTHQVAAYEHASAGKDVVVVTGTASGKTLCYNLPILDRICQESEARALYLFPTKALARDQLKNLLELLAGSPALKHIKPGVFDGDTPTAQRRRIKAESQLVLSNPDMLHASILPYHPKWATLFSQLRFIVLDEVHTYRGILGAHVSCVVRRLLRVCEHYSARPVIIAASATIANPGELVERLIGRPVEVVDDDGAPRGRKYFALWNPSPLGKDQLARRSATDDAVHLMTEAILEGGQALAFTRTRQAAELLHRYVKEQLESRHFRPSDLGRLGHSAACSSSEPAGASLRSSPGHPQSGRAGDLVRAYRGGYLPNERREIEQQLFSGELRGVAATNALELGIDIGSLDVALLVGYPGTIASTWQQAGRSGRRHDESLAVLLAGNDPVDQYLLRHPEYFFARSPEHAVVDPENPYVLAGHLKAAAFELPLEEGDAERFGPLALPIAGMLEDEHDLSQVGGRYYYSGSQNPAVRLSLRHMSDNTFSIVLRRHGAKTPSGDQQHEVIANVDAISAPELVYPEAVYLHNGESYFVRELDLAGKVAYVERHEMDYYTQAVLESSVTIKDARQTGAEPAEARVSFGDVDVTWQTVAFKKIKFGTRENIGQGPVDIPAQTLATTALWIAPNDEVRRQLKAEGLKASEAMVGLRNLAVVSLPIVAMCDSRDIGGVVDSKNLGTTTAILYDRYPGGLGYCEKGFHQVGELLRICLEIAADCPCQEGCPSCVGLPNLRPAMHSDPDLVRGYPMPNKQAALRLLELLCPAPVNVS